MSRTRKSQQVMFGLLAIALGAAGVHAQPQQTPTPDDLLSLPPVTEGQAAAEPADGLLSLPQALPPDNAAAVPGQPPVQPVANAVPDQAPAQLQPVVTPVPGQPPGPGQPTVQPVPSAPTPEQQSQETLNALLPNPLDIVSDSGDAGFKPSYGSWQYSIMYPATEMTNLKNILALYERKGFIVEQQTPDQLAEQEPQPTVDDVLKKLESQPLPTNLAYPSFKLRSIIYNGANNWSVWLNNRRITSENNGPQNEIAVVQVNRDFAEFAWVPTNAELLSAILQVRLLPEDRRPPLSETPKHRKATNNQSDGWLDKSTSVVHFILRPNQIFYAETFEVFEGTPQSLSASLDNAIHADEKPTTASTTTEDPTKIIKDLQQQLEAAEKAPPPPGTAEQKAMEFINEKQNPKAQMMRTLGLGQ